MDENAKETSVNVVMEESDATNIAGTSQGTGQNRQSIGAVSGLTTEDFQDGFFTGNCKQKEPHVEKTAERKPSATTTDNSTKTSSFAQLVKSWETYISDAQSAETFQPMQMLQNLRLCGTGHEIPRLTLAPSTEFTNASEGQDPFEPIILRHIHSNPLQYRPSIFNDYEVSGMPPPAELNTTRRSSSTPSRGSAFQQFKSRSAFGLHTHTASNLSSTGGRSAFGFPLHRSAYSGVSTESSIHNSAFNPVPPSLSTTQEESHQGENTAIEVMDLGREEDEMDVSVAEANEQGAVEIQIDAEGNDSDQAKPKKSAAARAARFLSDVGVLRRKKKSRSSIMSVVSADKLETSREEVEAQQSDSADDDEQMTDFVHSSSMYHQLDSDVDEEYDRYQSIENSARDSDDTGSPGTVPSPDYHPMEDDRPATSTETRRPAVRIQVSNHISVLPRITERMDNDSSQDQLMDDVQRDTPTSSSHSAGGTTRSSATTNTSGHTTQATSTTSTSGNASRHSQISETDREVMETIKEGKRRRLQESNPATDKCDGDVSVNIGSSSSSSSTTNDYGALSGSPGPLRDGANVMADRFFTNSRSPLPHGGYPSCNSSVSATVGGADHGLNGLNNARGRTTSMPMSRKSNSNSSPTSCSLNSIDETPPKFVSYLDRVNASDLTSLREGNETSTSRGDAEEREDSPAQIVGFPAVFMHGTDGSSDGQENAMSVLPKLVLPTTEHLYNMLGKFRSRPPRSPAKGLRTTAATPPPHRGSPYHHQLSPPRKIVDHRIESNVSRPYVVRKNPTTQKLVVVSPGSYVRPTTPLVCIPVFNSNNSPCQNRPLATWPEQPLSPNGNSLVSRTYEEHSIEILKTDSKDEMICQR